MFTHLHFKDEFVPERSLLFLWVVVVVDMKSSLSVYFSLFSYLDKITCKLI